MVQRIKEREGRSFRSVTMRSTLEKKASAVMTRAEECALAIVTAESCTAGALATLLADTPGAGACFHGGFVTYAKACKTSLLAIPPGVIAAQTAVSREVAERMAAGALEACGADIAVAVTGVLGPEPDDDGNPVGLVYIAATRRGGRMHHARIETGEASRAANRERALAAALSLLEAVVREVPTETGQPDD